MHFFPVQGHILPKLIKALNLPHPRPLTGIPGTLSVLLKFNDYKKRFAHFIQYLKVSLS